MVVLSCWVVLGLLCASGSAIPAVCVGGRALRSLCGGTPLGLLKVSSRFIIVWILGAAWLSLVVFSLKIISSVTLLISFLCIFVLSCIIWLCVSSERPQALHILALIELEKVSTSISAKIWYQYHIFADTPICWYWSLPILSISGY